MSKRSAFSTTDFVNGLTPSYLLGLLDDVKWRDTVLKATQNVLKLNSAVIRDYGLMAEEGDLMSKKFDAAAGTLGMARRCFRFLRWTRFVHNLPTDLNQNDILSLILRAIHHVSTICSCVFEDITTLGKLKLIDSAFAGKFEPLQMLAWFSESVTGVIIHLRAVLTQLSRFAAARKEYKRFLEAEKNIVDAKSDKDERRRAIKANCFQEYVKLHFSEVTCVKFVAETIASSKELGYHSYGNVAIASSLASALISTYTNSAASWK